VHTSTSACSRVCVEAQRDTHTHAHAHTQSHHLSTLPSATAQQSLINNVSFMLNSDLTLGAFCLPSRGQSAHVQVGEQDWRKKTFHQLGREARADISLTKPPTGGGGGGGGGVFCICIVVPSSSPLRQSYSRTYFEIYPQSTEKGNMKIQSGACLYSLALIFPFPGSTLIDGNQHAFSMHVRFTLAPVRLIICHPFCLC